MPGYGLAVTTAEKMPAILHPSRPRQLSKEVDAQDFLDMRSLQTCILGGPHGRATSTALFQDHHIVWILGRSVLAIMESLATRKILGGLSLS